MLDLLLANYSNVDWIMDQECSTGIELIIKAKERQDEERKWMLYCAIFPTYTSDTFKTFEEFNNKNSVKINHKPKEKIIDEVGAMRKKYGWG